LWGFFCGVFFCGILLDFEARKNILIVDRPESSGNGYLTLVFKKKMAMPSMRIYTIKTTFSRKKHPKIFSFPTDFIFIRTYLTIKSCNAQRHELMLMEHFLELFSNRNGNGRGLWESEA